MSPRHVKDHYYHIYNHSIDGLRLFYTSENYNFLLGKIASSLWEYEVDLIAYCLMPNHYHFFARQLSETPLSSWIQSIFNSYSQALNHQLQRHGTVFIVRAEHINVVIYSRNLRKVTTLGRLGYAFPLLPKTRILAATTF
ncbi:hypothetical protein GX408_04390 [bacterium]|nr:hypothetical protein [bacterium]